ncbi:MAG: GTPase HflX [Clostridiales bacterium]|nr:GTPase HflX [Clostridiales bacterium]
MEEIFQNENVFVIEPIDNDKELSIEFLIDEIYSLITSANGTPVGYNAVKIREITPATYIGKGKVEEIYNQIQELDVDTVVFDGALSPSQTLNLKDALGVKVIDRTTLILDIFALSASTHEGKIQVELAQLEYLYPRLKGKGQALSRLGGGIGTRGPGETKLETDRRHIRSRIDKLKQELKDLETRRKLQSYRREKNDEFVISLVGYTNVGKSTLINKLTGSDVLVKDKLFATLDPTIRKTKINGINVLITDTVGFIRDIPHNLIEAFKSTLESASQADLVLIVCDATSDYQRQLEVTESTLKDLDYKADTLLVLNKCDKIENINSLDNKFTYISAKDGKNMNVLFDRIKEILNKYYVNTTLKIDYTELSEFTKLTKYLESFELKYQNDCILAEVAVRKNLFSKFSKYKKT